MKKWMLFVAMFTMATLANATRKHTDDDHFLIQGKIYEQSLSNEEEQKEISHAQIVVYQDQEIFVSFYTDEHGSYEFNLPTGHEYEIWFGGSVYVNKRVYIDTRAVSSRPGGYDLDFDISLFKPVAGFEFAMLGQPLVKMAWNKEESQFTPDVEYTEIHMKELEKSLKKVRKERKG